MTQARRLSPRRYKTRQALNNLLDAMSAAKNHNESWNYFKQYQRLALFRLYDSYRGTSFDAAKYPLLTKDIETARALFGTWH